MRNQIWTLTVDQVAKRLGISRGLAYDMVRQGKIPSLRLGKRLLIPQRALERLLESPNQGGSERGTN